MNLRIKTLALVLAVLLLAGCGAQAPAETTLGKDAVYSVTVADALGTPYTTGVIVCFMKDGQQVAMQPVDGSGVAAKTLERGDYTVELVFTGNEGQYHYEKEGLNLTAETTELTVELAMTVLQSTPLYAPEGETVAYGVTEGSNYLPLTAGKRNYFLYAPTTAGTYEFALIGEGVSLGYYGAPHFVQSENAAEVTDNRFSISVRADMIGTGNTGTTVLVIGVDAENADSTVLTVQRTGDPEWSIADEPWHIYQPATKPENYTLPAGAALKNFDIKAGTYNLVLGTDGFYHLNTADGPLVLVWLGEDTEYLACFKAILDRSGVTKYFYDAEGNFQKKESYSECLLEYIACMDEDAGVYPLTEDLKYIIQQRGDHSGWFDADSQGYLFKDKEGNKIPGINSDISWLFMCCYIEG